jgi:hypothetical protein
VTTLLAGASLPLRLELTAVTLHTYFLYSLVECVNGMKRFEHSPCWKELVKASVRVGALLRVPP